MRRSNKAKGLNLIFVILGAVDLSRLNFVRAKSALIAASSL